MEFSKLKERLFNSTIRYISVRIRSEKEIREFLSKKLCKRKISEEEATEIVEKIISRLKDFNLLNDEEFAKSLIEGKLKSRRAKGLIAIRRELFRKGILKDIVDTMLGLSEYRRLEVSSAKSLMKRKMGKFKGLDETKLRIKVKNYLLQRGFTYDSIEEAFDEVFKKP